MEQVASASKGAAYRQLLLLAQILERELQDAELEAYHPTPRCPHCESELVKKRGRDSYGKQRYKCGACSRSFTASSQSEFSSTNLPLETWLLFAECHVNKLALRESAIICNVSLKTAFYMRKRLISAIRRYSQQVKKQLKLCQSINRPIV